MTRMGVPQHLPHIHTQRTLQPARVPACRQVARLQRRALHDERLLAAASDDTP